MPLFFMEPPMNPEILAFISFVLITTYTPGPNNISSASMGVLYGYKRTLPYLFGIALGFFVVLSLCGLLSGFLLEKIPAFEQVLRIVGALYILWLAWHTLRATYSFEEEDQKPLGFIQGFLLQVLNVKAIVYGTDDLFDLPRRQGDFDVAPAPFRGHSGTGRFLLDNALDVVWCGD